MSKLGKEIVKAELAFIWVWLWFAITAHVIGLKHL